MKKAVQFTKGAAGRIVSVLILVLEEIQDRLNLNFDPRQGDSRCRFRIGDTVRIVYPYPREAGIKGVVKSVNPDLDETRYAVKVTDPPEKTGDGLWMLGDRHLEADRWRRG